jgi:hypothetical protein
MWKKALELEASALAFAHTLIDGFHIFLSKFTVKQLITL